MGQCGPLNAFLTSGAAAGPVHAAYGAAVATKRGFRVSFFYFKKQNKNGALWEWWRKQKLHQKALSLIK